MKRITFTLILAVLIPANVTKMGSYAFLSCTTLEKITSLAKTPPACHIPYPEEGGYEDYSNTFAEVATGTCLLLVPEGCSGAYKRAAGWKEFTTTEEIDASRIKNTTAANGNGMEKHYDLSGKETGRNVKGIHIIQACDGSTRKITVR